jgi:hypothetical protein
VAGGAVVHAASVSAPAAAVVMRAKFRLLMSTRSSHPLTPIKSNDCFRYRSSL